MKFATAIIISFTYFIGYSQTQIILKPTKLDSIIKYENSVSSVSKGFHFFNPYYDEDFEDIYSTWAQVIKKPLIFKRTNDEFFPILHSWYFYDNDSIIKMIKYNWGFANTKVEASNDLIKNQILRKREFKKKYKKEKSNLIMLLGTPTNEDILKETASYLNLKTIWNSPYKRVVLNMTIDKKVIEFDSKEIGKTIVIPRSEIQIKILLK